MNVRGRFLLSVLVAVCVVASGTAFERVLGHRRPVAPPRVEEISGAWFCPHSGGRGWRVWVAAANPGERPARIVLTTYERGQRTRVRDRLEPGTQRYFPVTAPDKAGASVLEFFGEQVAAGTVALRPDGGGLGAEPCAARAGSRWYVTEGTSVRGHASKLVVLNPFAEPAVIDVTLYSEDEVLHPGPMSGVVLKPARATSFDLNEVALGKETLTASVHASLGKVVVGGLAVGERGLRSVLGVTGPAERWMLPGGADDGSSSLIVLAPGEEQVPFRVRAQGPDQQVSVLDDATVAGGSARTFGVEAENATVVAEADGPQPLLAGRRLDAGGGAPAPERRGGGRRAAPGASSAPVDQASTSGTPGGAAVWVSVSPLPPGGGRSLLMVENAGSEPAEAAVTLLTDSGPETPADLGTLDVPPGATVMVDLSEVSGEGPLAAVVETASGSLVVSQAGQTDTGYAVSLGIPLPGSSQAQMTGI